MVKLSRDESGQAITEYLLLLSLIVGIFVAASSALRKSRLGEKLMLPVSGEFARIYQYGHPKAKGFEDGSPEWHPRWVGAQGDTNFRIFIVQDKRAP